MKDWQILVSSIPSSSDVSSFGWSLLTSGDATGLGFVPKIPLQLSMIFSMCLLGAATQDTTFVSEEVEFDASSSFQPELALSFKFGSDLPRLATDDEQIIDADRDTFAVVSPVSHPNAPLRIGRKESHFPQNI